MGGYINDRVLLPGIRFAPMEDELLMDYLKPKANGQVVPGGRDFIPEMDLYGELGPWEIWEQFEERRTNDLRKQKDLYFFDTHKTISETDSRKRRKIKAGGTWRGQAGAEEIYFHEDEPKSARARLVLGYKKTYTYQNRGSDQDKQWTMYEYTLHQSQIADKKQENMYVLCLLRKHVETENQRKRKLQRQDHEEEQEDARLAAGTLDEQQRKRQCHEDIVPFPPTEDALDSLHEADLAAFQLGEIVDTVQEEAETNSTTTLEDDDWLAEWLEEDYVC